MHTTGNDVPVSVTLIDPWDLVTETGSGPFPALITELWNDGSALLHLIAPLWHQGIAWPDLRATPRHDHDRLDRLDTSKRVHVNAILISGATGSIEQTNRFTPARGPAVIADIFLSHRSPPAKNSATGM